MSTLIRCAYQHTGTVSPFLPDGAKVSNTGGRCPIRMGKRAIRQHFRFRTSVHRVLWDQETPTPLRRLACAVAQGKHEGIVGYTDPRADGNHLENY